MFVCLKSSNIERNAGRSIVHVIWRLLATQLQHSLHKVHASDLISVDAKYLYG